MATAVRAQTLPPIPTDPRIQVVNFVPDQIIPVRVTSGYQMMVEFAADEHIENVALGDGTGWQAVPDKRGDRLFLKTDGGATTNLTVVTDARTYLFELSSASGGAPVYMMRFAYTPATEAAASTDEQQVDGRFKLTGAREIRPSAIHDDGAKTYIIWPPERAMPATFLIDGAGRETLANGAMRDGRYVIDGIADRFVFRLDDKQATATRSVKIKR
ncbi:MAG: TrbG/VirB9 family P-type conjugative transfer protein [Sphingomonas sp.]|uniref:TrbG/VirB9 family P-type conjugative transfer protein n=1 Tax=Sphingomonas sp. TaxID=28214 RepID=UPI001ACAC022|nr:TrbG/VirB9 family P-type conjugative transfer protein [Sphingomonas sp.]MBN8809648.1 TrbG/VirB9 family P-type conjugative transfer protein [Sphingomonas sp.]